MYIYILYVYIYNDNDIMMACHEICNHNVNKKSTQTLLLPPVRVMG